MESGWNVWVWLLVVVVRRYIDFLILLIPTPLLFYTASLLFVHFKKCFLVEERMPNRDFFTSRGENINLRYYSDVIHLLDWKSAVEHDGGVSARYSNVCNVLRQWRIWLIPTYRLYDIVQEHVLSGLIRDRKFSNFDMSGAIRGRKIICRAIIIIRNIH